MQNRRHFLQTGLSMAAATFAGAAALTGARGPLAQDAPPETTSVRLEKWPVTCLAPVYIVDDLLREEGFSDIRHVAGAWVGRGDADFGNDFPAPMIIPIGIDLADAVAGLSPSAG